MSSYKSAMKELQAQGDEKASKRAKLILQWSKIEVIVLICLVASWMWFRSTSQVECINNINSFANKEHWQFIDSSLSVKQGRFWETKEYYIVWMIMLSDCPTIQADMRSNRMSLTSSRGALISSMVRYIKSASIKELTEPENCCSSCLTVETRSLSCEQHLSTVTATLADTLEGNSFIPSTKDWIVQVFYLASQKLGQVSE